MNDQKKYPLPFKSRLFLWLFGLFRKRRQGLPTPRDLRRARMVFPRFFLVNWILGRPDRRVSTCEVQAKGRMGEIPVRVYARKSADKKQATKPLVMNFHGGGWAVGNLQNNDFYCSMLAAELDVTVVSVDYRLAPEHKFPTALHDCYDALMWALNGQSLFSVDAAKVVVTGDSAGGNLAAAVCLMARDLNGPPICFQALIYPAVDASLHFPSIQEHAEAPILHRSDMQAFLRMYARDEKDLTNPYLSPWFASSLTGMPPACVLTAGYDPLQDDGKHWVERLHQAGVPAHHLHYPRDFHGFVSIPHFTANGLAANRAVCAEIGRALGR